MNREDEIRLREWWMDQLRAITKKLIDEENRREERARVKAQKALGEYQTEADIQDAYAYGVITEAKRDKLMDLLEKGTFNALEDKDYRMRMDFLQQDWQNQKEILEKLKTADMEVWA